MSDTMIKNEGMRVLRDKLGLVEAEKFITLMRREPFNYTEWRRDLWSDKSVSDIFEAGNKIEDNMK